MSTGNRLHRSYLSKASRRCDRTELTEVLTSLQMCQQLSQPALDMSSHRHDHGRIRALKRRFDCEPSTLATSGEFLRSLRSGVIYIQFELGAACLRHLAMDAPLLLRLLRWMHARRSTTSPSIVEDRAYLPAWHALSPSYVQSQLEAPDSNEKS